MRTSPLRFKKQSQATRTEAILQEKWRNMPLEEMKAYLGKLLIAEYNCHPRQRRKKEFTKQLSQRCRWRRLVVTNHLSGLGVKISELATAHALPKGKNWPGVVFLIERKGIELATKQNPTPIYNP
jgi:hypothetical protein